jgi:hypothetical protein
MEPRPDVERRSASIVRCDTARSSASPRGFADAVSIRTALPPSALKSVCRREAERCLPSATSVQESPGGTRPLADLVEVAGLLHHP